MANLTLPQKGQKFFKEVQVSFDQANRYAEASGDFNPIHLDEDFAHSVGLKGTILHGLCTLAFLSQSACEFMECPQDLRQLKCRFKAPVYPGDLLKIHGQVLESSPEKTTLILTCLNQKDEKIISNAQAIFFPEEKLTASKAFSLKTLEIPLESTFTISQKSIQDYALATNDSNPLFWDEDFAKKSPFGQIMSPPLFCVLFTMGLFKKAFFEGKPAKNLPKIIHGGQDFEFFRFLKAGDKITTKGGIEKSSQKGGQDFIYFVTESRNQNQDLVTKGRTLAIVN